MGGGNLFVVYKFFYTTKHRNSLFICIHMAGIWQLVVLKTQTADLENANLRNTVLESPGPQEHRP